MVYTVKDSLSPKHFISWGAGLQSTALGVLSVNNRLPEKMDGIIFADPGWEHPYTYKILEFYTEYFNSRCLPVELTRVDNSIEDFGWENSPPFFYTNGAPLTRQCTAYYKIKPIRRAMRKLSGFSQSNTGRTLRKSCYCYMGISYDEAHRMRDSDRDWIVYKYPLVDMKWTRKECVNLFIEYNLPVPMKSSCVICPYHRNKDWALIKEQYPEEWKRIILFDRKIRSGSPGMIKRDKNAQCYLYHKAIPLEDVDFSQIDVNKNIEDYCDAGYCFI